MSSDSISPGEPSERDNNSTRRRGAPRREESARRVREAQRTLSRMDVARSELTGRPLRDRAIACLFYYRCVRYRMAALAQLERRVRDLRRNGGARRAIDSAVRELDRVRTGPGPYGAGLLLTGPNPRPTDDAFLAEWRDARAAVRTLSADRVGRHLRQARAGKTVYGLRFTRVGERWRGFARPDPLSWAALELPGRLWRFHEHEFRFSGTDAYGEPALPGRFGALHAVPVGLRGEPTLEAATAVDVDPAYPLALVEVSTDELESLRAWIEVNDPLGETVAEFLVRNTGDRWEADKKRLGRLRRDAAEVEFRHLGDIERLGGRRMLPDFVLTELRRKPTAS